jgi:two-component system cell cycle response regulator
MGQKKKKRAAGESDTTRILNPATDTLKLDMELAKASSALLIIIRGSPQGKKYELKTEEFIIGRDKSADIQINDPNISRRHSKIKRAANGYTIEDCGSRNGTIVNDEKIETPRKLSKEDMIKIGGTILKYLPAGELETLFHANLTNAAFMDKLTGLYNRNYISDVLESEFKRAKALHSHLAIVLFDIDNFKKINDTFGHPGGDYVLSEIGKTVKDCGLRERDFVGRFGGEEFLLILNNSTAEQAQEVAERVRKNIETHEFKYSHLNIQVTVSLGVAEVKKEHHTSPDFYRAADEALYKSKAAGKNRVTVSE